MCAVVGVDVAVALYNNSSGDRELFVAGADGDGRPRGVTAVPPCQVRPLARIGDERGHESAAGGLAGLGEAHDAEV